MSKLILIFTICILHINNLYSQGKSSIEDYTDSFSSENKTNQNLIHTKRNMIFNETRYSHDNRISVGIGLLPEKEKVYITQIEFIKSINPYLLLLVGLDGILSEQIFFDIMPYYNLSLIKRRLDVSVGGGVQIGSGGIYSIASGRLEYKYKLLSLGLEVKKPFLFKKNYTNTPYLIFNLGYYLQ